MEAFAKQLLGRIDFPSHPELRRLQRQAIQNVEDIVAGAEIPQMTEEVIRRLSYTYYYDWETDDPEYLWLVQDPGNVHERHLDELRGENLLADGCTPREQVSVYRNFGESWLTGRNADFSAKMLTTLDELGLIELEGSWKEYIEEERFYEDIYVGDVVKYRVDGFSRQAERLSYTAFLEDEIRELSPSLIFSFGGNAWRTIRRELDPSVVDGVAIDSSSMMDSHGHLHYVETPVETYVLPLSHMSSQVWWRFPPDEYISRMQAGLSRWQEVQ